MSNSLAAPELLQKCQILHSRVEPDQFPDLVSKPDVTQPRRPQGGKPTKTPKQPEPKDLTQAEKEALFEEVGRCYRSVLAIDKQSYPARWNLARVRLHLRDCLTAGHLYIGLAKEGTEGDRKTISKTLAQFPDICPWVRVDLSDADKDNADLLVTRDGEAVPRELRDRFIMGKGAHTIRVVAPGKEPWSQQLQIDAIKGYTVSVPPLRAVGMIGQKKAAIALGVLGVASLLASIPFAVVARSKRDKALDPCKPPIEGETWCSPTANMDEVTDLDGEAFTHAVVSTAFLGVGVAAVAGGAILWLKAPDPSKPATTPSARVFPVLTMTGYSGLLLQGSF